MHQPRALLEEAAANAFWDLGAMALGRVAALEAVGIKFAAGARLCSKLWELIRKILPSLTEDEVVQIIQLRVRTDDYMALFAELDDCQDLVAKEDLRDFDKERADMAKGVENNRSLRSD